ncbi:hypothetical protein DUI87_29823 [Hirundo rustica rustica]|uniref:small monomeric GTPase n=1 Tax=Hirundo rustica rustica TaxID=333673 RepID=A0A3M0J0D9_HIRRU|nr:hypothetical protein DUI87_29823 [Hirundo rustica rustica]
MLNKDSVSTEEGMSLAREYSCSFFETSAVLRFYIDDVFHGLVREIRRKESSLSMIEKKMKRKDSLWRKLKGSLKKKRKVQPDDNSPSATHQQLTTVTCNSSKRQH